MKALNILAVISWTLGAGGIMDQAGEFQPMAAVLFATGLAVHVVTAGKGNHRKEKP